MLYKYDMFESIIYCVLYHRDHNYDWFNIGYYYRTARGNGWKLVFTGDASMCIHYKHRKNEQLGKGNRD